MNRFVKWRDQSHRMSRTPERWVPEAIISLYDGNTVTEKPVYLSDADIQKVARGELIFSTRDDAKAAACELAKRAAWSEWHIGGDSIQELMVK